MAIIESINKENKQPDITRDNYFKTNLVFRLEQHLVSGGMFPEFMEDDSIRRQCLNFLKYADTGIRDIKVSTVEIPEEAKPLEIKIK